MVKWIRKLVTLPNLNSIKILLEHYKNLKIFYNKYLDFILPILQNYKTFK